MTFRKRGYRLQATSSETDRAISISTPSEKTAEQDYMRLTDTVLEKLDISPDGHGSVTLSKDDVMLRRSIVTYGENGKPHINTQDDPLGQMYTRYRIRIGKAQFADPHYMVALGRHARFASIVVNKKPLSWKSKAVADAHLADIKDRFTSAEIEPYQDAPTP